MSLGGAVLEFIGACVVTALLALLVWVACKVFGWEFPIGRV